MRRIKTNSLGARVLSGFLSLLMVVSACPVSALADGNVDNTPVETTTTTIVVDETGVHTDGEDNNSYTIIVEDELMMKTMTHFLRMMTLRIRILRMLIIRQTLMMVLIVEPQMMKKL